MVTIRPTGAVLGATIEGVDLSRPLGEDEFGEVLVALGRHGVLRFPDQDLDAAALKAFSERFGEIQGAISGTSDHDGQVPGVGVLSNIMENGCYIGSPDAGQDWHTDMSYRDVMGFVNVLYGIQIPRRNGRALGGTEFANMHLAYEGLAEEIKVRLRDATAVHDFNKFWDHMRRDKASLRPPLTDAQRRQRPPVTHPLFLTHPLTGRPVLYANPGYTVRINELSDRESDEMLELLFAHQLQPKYRYLHTWTERDVLVWDHLGTIHQAIADYGPAEHRLLKRCQVMATKVFDPGFLRQARGEAVRA
jgi:alpha-ketoglutarate-dependent taurine dioxygenase